jgi:hypothetical protein
MPGVLDFQQPFVQSTASLTTWSRDHSDKIGLADVIANAKPTAPHHLGVVEDKKIPGAQQCRQVCDLPVLEPA